MKKYLWFLFSFAVGAILGFNVWILHSLPNIEILKNYNPVLATRVYDRNGEWIRDLYTQRRIPVPLDSIPAYVKGGLISVEDKEFYHHHGLNYKRMIKAILIDIIKRRKVQGASTITQQLARNILLSPEKSFIRKFSEIYLALELERYYTKNDILEMYLNHVYFGYGNYGIEAASEYYFGKPVGEISLKEAAALVAIVRSPGYYSPYYHLDRCLRRTDLVLKSMLEEGYIDSSQLNEASAESLVFIKAEERKRIGPYYIETVKNRLKSILGNSYLTMGGYSVYIAMDKHFQEVADSIVEAGIEFVERKYRLKPKSEFPDSVAWRGNTPYLQGALVCMDPHTGDVLALVGGRDIKQSRFNRATMAKRQAGSAFKVFLYTAAIDNGYNPSDFILDLPIIVESQNKVYAPTNFDSTFMGKITLRKAFYLSRNLAAIRLTQQIGVFTIIDYAEKMGIKSSIEPVSSIALGPSGVTLLEMTDAFGTLDNYGVRIEPVIIKKIVDRYGNIVYEGNPARERVLSKQSAYIMINMLESVFNKGTAHRARMMGFTRPAAGKTGTANNFTDAWFLGFTPDVVTGVWVGYDYPHKIARYATGAGAALPVWVSFMKAVLDSTGPDFTEPKGIIHRLICEQSGLLATPYCPIVKDEIFIKGNEPDEKCNIHTKKQKKPPTSSFEKMDRWDF